MKKKKRMILAPVLAAVMALAISACSVSTGPDTIAKADRPAIAGISARYGAGAADEIKKSVHGDFGKHGSVHSGGCVRYHGPSVKYMTGGIV